MQCFWATGLVKCNSLAIGLVGGIALSHWPVKCNGFNNLALLGSNGMEPLAFCDAMVLSLLAFRDAMVLAFGFSWCIGWSLGLFCDAMVGALGFLWCNGLADFWHGCIQIFHSFWASLDPMIYVDDDSGQLKVSRSKSEKCRLWF